MVLEIGQGIMHWPCLKLKRTFGKSRQENYMSSLSIYLIASVVRSVFCKCHVNYYHVPDCQDAPKGYWCECGPGFTWNTFTCVANGLDSKLEFASATPERYAMLLNKPFQELSEFTVSLWLKVWNSSHPGTILSYCDRRSICSLILRSGPSLSMQILTTRIVSNVKLNASEWTHVTWTWSANDGAWTLQINGGVHRVIGTVQTPSSPPDLLSRTPTPAHAPLPPGGQLILGQTPNAPKHETKFEPCCAFLGEMSFVNIWRTVLEQRTLGEVADDCKLMQCGDAVQWADFRSGTRGAMRMRWPSNIQDPSSCYSEEESFRSCNKYCSDVKGVLCIEEVLNNIRWVRTPVDMEVTVPCPGHLSNSTSKYVRRACQRTEDDQGIWSKPNLDECIPLKELFLQKQISTLLDKSTLNSNKILHQTSLLSNLTSTGQYSSITEIWTVVESLHTLITAQRLKIKQQLSRSRGEGSGRVYGVDRLYDQRQYPTWTETNIFAQETTRIIDNLLSARNAEAWESSEPAGAEADRLFQVIDDLVDLLADSLWFHVGRGEVNDHKMASINIVQSRIELQVKIYSGNESNLIQFPDNEDGRHESDNDDHVISDHLTASVIHEGHNDDTDRRIDDFSTVSIGRYLVGRIFSNRQINSKDDNLNSHVMSFNVHSTSGPRIYGASRRKTRREQSIMIAFTLTYLNNENISNPECAMLVHGNETIVWSWSARVCHIEKISSEFVVCACPTGGHLALLSDMYDVNWQPEDEALSFITLPSIIGCSSSILFCLTSFILLTYYRTSSKTASLHKHFSLAIIGGQLSIMFGIEQIRGSQMVCRLFAVSIHYFFLSTFLWLMNEAFNLYIVITYEAHSHGQNTEGGSQRRYYVLGWVLPAVLVGTFVGVQTDGYYSTAMCLIAWNHIWLFLGPVIGIIVVTMLVLIFTAKEQRESSYSKNEKTNKTISLYTKALWTQVILLSVCWMFAILSLKMRGHIIKWLYALFNILQGSFFLVFYFMLNEEVRTILIAQQKNRELRLPTDSQPHSASPFAQEIAPQASAECIEMHDVSGTSGAGCTTGVPFSSSSSTGGAAGGAGSEGGGGAGRFRRVAGEAGNGGDARRGAAGGEQNSSVSEQTALLRQRTNSSGEQKPDDYQRKNIIQQFTTAL